MSLDQLSLDALRGSRPGTIGQAGEKARTQLSYATAATSHTSWIGRARPLADLLRDEIAAGKFASMTEVRAA
jgi:hypothetical protein